ncbi:MAG: hypothetical protein PUD59_04770 [bacterium]|nr:hypothetical protein [bacterium]
MKNNWGVNSLIEDEKKLKEALKIETDLEKIIKIKDAIKLIDSYIIDINLEKNDFNKTNLSFDEILTEEFEEFRIYYPYVEYLEKFKNALKKDKFKKVRDNIQTDVRLNKNEHIELIGEFYKSLDEEFYNCFNRILNNGAIKFYSDIYSNDEYGIMFFIDYIEKIYIKQFYYRNQPDCESITTGVHEFGHGVAALMNPKRYTDNSLQREIETCFFELSCTDFYEEIFKTNGFYLSAYEYLKDNYCDIICKLDEIKILEEYSKLNKKGKIISNSKLASKYNLDYADRIPYNAIMGYCIGINIFELYKNDKEKAIWILKQIINSNRANECITILKNVDTKSKVLNYKRSLEERLFSK